jgi:hypothetical protein
MTFVNPSYLWALIGLAIPIAIHLLSRKEGKVIRVGSLRHVEESNTSQFKSIRPNEILLLLLRCLMISLVVLFMSGAQCSGTVNKNIKWVVAERGINVDTLLSKGYELHEMPEGNYWTYVEELNKLPYDVVVVSYSKLENFKGERTRLNDNIKWITAESAPKEFQALAWTAGDSVFLRTAKSNSMVTTYHTTIGVPDSIEIIKPSVVNVSTGDKIVLAALNVLKKQYKLPIETSNSQQTITNIQVTPNVGPLVERVSPTEIHINKGLDQDMALNNNLVIELFKVLYPEFHKTIEDVRVLPDEVAFSKKNNIALASMPNKFGIENYVIGLFILILAIERFVAIRRNQ